MRRRWILWLVGLLAYTVLLVPYGTVLLSLAMASPGGDLWGDSWVALAGELLADGDWWLTALISCSVIAVTQLAFLLPVVRLRPPGGQRGRSLTVSLWVGAAVAALLTVGLCLAVVELVAGLVHGDLAVNPWGTHDELMSELWAGPGMLVTSVGSWMVWLAALLVFSRQLWADTLLGRLVLLLFGGTVVELLVVVPIDIMVRRRTDCYCATGTFFSLCFSAIAIVWLTGPGIVIAVTARPRRLARRTHCGRCGHAKGPSPGPACPECGYAWLGRAGEKGRGDRRDSNP
ncbi:MAG: hypothetical protein ACYTE6_05430 [Planctomycetota bacterium]|jgi:hypothetical protein